MAQEYKSVGIAGAGASGCICAYFLLQHGIDVTLFDIGAPLRTLLPTGGGRCNLAHAEYDFTELAKNYPRGEKFLYSVFSRFSASDTVSLFEELGIETYTQDDGRIFPVSNSSKEVRNIIISKIKKANFIKEQVIKIVPSETGIKVKTNKAEYLFDKFVVSTGGKGAIEGLKHKVNPYFPSLVGLNTDIKNLSGIVLKNIYSNDFGFCGDMLFTHFGISGPLTYKISSLKALDKFPYKLSFKICDILDFQELLNKNSQKELKNILSKFMPAKFAIFICGEYANIKAHEANGKIRDEILYKINNFILNITGTNKGEETVTAGGYDLNEINPKTMESKIHPHIYFTGEVLDIDGFCGGFNLQNAWSTAYVAAQAICNC